MSRLKDFPRSSGYWLLTDAKTHTCRSCAPRAHRERLPVFPWKEEQAPWGCTGGDSIAAGQEEMVPGNISGERLWDGWLSGVESCFLDVSTCTSTAAGRSRGVGEQADRDVRRQHSVESPVQFPICRLQGRASCDWGSLQWTEQHLQHGLFDSSWHEHRTWRWFLIARLYYKKNSVSTEIPRTEAKDIQARTVLLVLLQK